MILKVTENNNLFIDKSLFIKDIIDDASEFLLLLRPRKFGKTLNMSMLSYYEITKIVIDFKGKSC